MAREQWFRRTDWNAEIEAAFFEKLCRARDKSRYLRIQAGVIASCKPDIALRLLDEYFALGGHCDQAQAHVDRASVCLALGDIERAIGALEAGLTREEQYGQFQTCAYLELPLLIACYRIESRYERALRLLKRHRRRLTLPVDYFRWNSAYSLILSARGQIAPARTHARRALAAAAKPHSGFREHPGIGLVRSKYKEIRGQLLKAAA